jgi:excisionase family DNA binding protein
MAIEKSTFLTTSQAAAALNVSPARVRKLIADNRIKSVKTGRDHMIEAREIQKFLEQGRMKRGRPIKILR